MKDALHFIGQAFRPDGTLTTASIGQAGQAGYTPVKYDLILFARNLLPFNWVNRITGFKKFISHPLGRPR